MQLSLSKELELLEKLTQRNSHAFAQIYNAYIKKVYSYALSIVKSPMLAEDITHDTFVKLWENSQTLYTDRSIQSYLYTLTRNNCLNTIRRAAKETWISDEIIAFTTTNTENGLQFTERKETGRYINLALDQLPPQRRIIYDLCRNEGYSYKQVAEKLGIKDSTVNSQMVKANKTIRDFMLRNGALLILMIYKF